MNQLDSESSVRTAVLLIAHGSRRQTANNDLVQLAEMLHSTNQYDVIEHAYLELVEPTITQGFERCLKSNPDRIVMLPYFLSAGAHVVDDLEQFRNQFVEQNPNIECVLCPPLGLHPKMVEIVQDRIREGGARSPERR